MRNRTFVLLCALLVSLPALASLFGLLRPAPAAAVAVDEARQLARPPEIELIARQGVVAYTRQVEAFVNDHFGLRSWLLASNGAIRRVFRSPASHEVVVGRDGWLFYYDGLVDRTAAGDEAAIPRLRAMADTAQALHEKFTAEGRRFVVLFAPDKHTIYPEMLPAWIRAKPSSRQLDWLVRELRERDVPVVDVRAQLHALKPVGPVYYRTDTHWTTIGALTAFNAVLAEAGEPPLGDVATLDIRDDDARTGMDLGRMALMGRTYPEYVVSRWRKDLEYTTTPLKIPNDPSRLAYRLERRGEGPKMAIIGDSFTRSYFRPMAMDYGKRLTWVHHRSCAFHWPTVRRARADLVVFQVVERNLGCAPAAAAKTIRTIRRSPSPT
jgi:alginate O-acetyltransferase complex protein AlgJ